MPSKNSLHSIKPTVTDTPILDPAKSQIKTASKPKIKRVNKGFQVEENRASQWDIFVAQMKNAPNKKNGAVLIDEALDLIFEKYGFVK